MSTEKFANFSLEYITLFDFFKFQFQENTKCWVWLSLTFWMQGRHSTKRGIAEETMAVAQTELLGLCEVSPTFGYITSKKSRRNGKKRKHLQLGLTPLQLQRNMGHFLIKRMATLFGRRLEEVTRSGDWNFKGSRRPEMVVGATTILQYL